MPIIALLLAWLSRLMMLKLGLWLVGAMVYLGLYFAVQDYAIGPLVEQIRVMAEGTLSGDLAEWAAFLNIDKAITMVLSAYSAAGTIAATKFALFRR